MSESLRVGNERCPECARQGKDRAGDNLVRYDDGHAFCFSCHYREWPTSVSLKHLHRRLAPSSDPFEPIEQKLGELTYKYPSEVQKWLDKYGVTELECVRNQIQWSPDKNVLVIPVIDHTNGEHVAYNCRYFGHNPKFPKYINEYPKGKAAAQRLALKLPERSPLPVLVLVEDLVSAIKVGRQGPSLALLGTNISPWLHTAIVQYCLSHRYSCLVWLDPDKKQLSVKYSRLFRQIIPSYPILSDKDPKYYNNEEIHGFLSNAISLSN